MSTDSEYNDLPSLVDQLSKFSTDLEAGNLSLEQLAIMTNNAREVYERLLILTYKTGELEASGNAVTASVVDSNLTDEPLRKAEKTNDPEPEAEPAQDQEPHVEAVMNAVKEEVTADATAESEVQVEEIPATATEEPTIKFDAPTLEEDNSAQTSLIDAIQQAENPEINDTLKNDDRETLIDKIGKSSIQDLKEAIGVNQKFLFMNELFAGENNDYNEAIEKLNSFQTKDEAVEFINSTLSAQFSWDMEGESATSFIDLVERRYPA